MEILFLLIECLVSFFVACFSLFGTLFWPLLVIIALIMIFTWA